MPKHFLSSISIFYTSYTLGLLLLVISKSLEWFPFLEFSIFADRYDWNFWEAKLLVLFLLELLVWRGFSRLGFDLIGDFLLPGNGIL